MCIYIIHIYNIYIYIYTYIRTYIYIYIYIYIYPFLPILFSISDPFQVKVMHHTLGMSNLLKWPINNNGIWYEKAVQKIAPPDPIHSSRGTAVFSIWNSLWVLQKVHIKIIACAIYTYLFFLYIHCPVPLENKLLWSLLSSANKTTNHCSIVYITRLF